MNKTSKWIKLRCVISKIKMYDSIILQTKTKRFYIAHTLILQRSSCQIQRPHSNFQNQWQHLMQDPRTSIAKCFSHVTPFFVFYQGCDTRRDLKLIKFYYKLLTANKFYLHLVLCISMRANFVISKMSS
jgi:hypothetical protein